MKIFGVLIVVLMVSAAMSQTNQRSNDEVLTKLSVRQGVKIDSVKFFSTATASVAWKAYDDLYFNFSNVNGLKREAGKAIAENPGVEKYVTEGMAALPHSSYNDSERAHFIVPLGDVPAPWGGRLLGKYLVDETPMTGPPPSDGYSVFTNSQRALGALSRLGFSDAPTKERDPDISPAIEKAWRDWWKANKGRIDQRIAEINSSYYYPTPFPAPFMPAPTPLVIGEYSTPPQAPKPTATPPQSPVPVIARKQSDSIIYIIGGIVVIAVLVGMARVLRKRG